MAVKNPNLLTISSGEAQQPFNYSVGVYGSRFFEELKTNKRFLGVRCPECRRVYIPPRPICGPCYRPMEEWTHVGPQGSLSSFTVIRFAFLDPETGQKKPVPYGYGLIRLDGADTNLLHFITLPQDGPLQVGDRLRPVFANQRHGTLHDIEHFERIS